MTRLTPTEAVNRVRSLAPGASQSAVEWGAGMLITVSRGGGDRVDPEKAWKKALEVSTKPYAATLLDAMAKVPQKPELLPEGWETAA